MRRPIKDQITCIDDWGFLIQQWFWWIPETIEQRIERLTYNQEYYKLASKCGEQKFPPEVNKDRMAEFEELRQLKGQKYAA